MKNLLSILCVCFISAMTLNAQNDSAQSQQADGPVMELESKVVEYGTIEKDSDPYREISFTNTGSEPLIIENAKGSCGCTVPTWPKEPVMPGESSSIKIRYSTNRIGKINKTVQITTNEGGAPHVIRVQGEVLKPTEKETLPKKSSVME